VVLYLGGPENPGAGFIVKPNQAMSWHALLLVYLGIAAVTLTIAVSFYIIGLTLILPFSGLEVIALGVALYICAWRGGVQEVIRITDDFITVERGRENPETRYKFQRSWVRVILERSWNSWYPSRLLIRSHGREVEIGQFLNEQERQGLAIELDRALKITTAGHIQFKTT
jgi:uncharacterized membrane protein